MDNFGMGESLRKSDSIERGAVIPASRSAQLAQQIEGLEGRLKEMRRAKELLDKNPEIEELVSLLQRI